ncbi:zinc ABC transporter ATP-binding protein [Bacteroidia bacterium]|nr:zinc ABC transporter ATP-binding protein [Bacteroidia bacterium]
MNKVLVYIENVSAGYDGNIVLKDVSLKIYEQDFLGVVGPNGGGKTTLVKLILGLIRPVSGTISFAHKDLKNRIGYMPQTNQIDRKFPILVSEVIASGLMAGRKEDKNTVKQKVEAMIAEMGLQAIAHKPVGALSGGQLQRTLLARAIIHSPELLILDEPNAYIDKPFEAHFYELLKEINRNTAIVLISHDLQTLLPNVKNTVYVNETVDI